MNDRPRPIANRKSWLADDVVQIYWGNFGTGGGRIQAVSNTHLHLGRSAVPEKAAACRV